MNEPGPKPVLWSTILIRVAMVLVLVAAALVAFAPKLANLFTPQRRATTSGDPADIRLIGVVPDGDDVLLDARGKVIPGSKSEWPGKRTYSWPQRTMLREFLFELGPGLEDLALNPDNPGTVFATDRRKWYPPVAHSMAADRVPAPGGRQRLLFRVVLQQDYYRRDFFFGGSQSPVEEIDLNLNFFTSSRGPATLNFDGPFAVGKTNNPRESFTAWLSPLAASSPQSSEGVPFELGWTGYFGSVLPIFVYDPEGRRHVTRLQQQISGATGATNQFVVPGVAVEKIAAITCGEQPRVKRFHNILVKYPDRPPRPHAAVLDRLAAALGKTNPPVTSLESFYPKSTREAMTVLEYLPGHREAVMSLANASSSTNFSELTPEQREKLRGLAADWADGPEGYERDIGLRLGLRGSWPEFRALALARLTNGSAADRIRTANELAWTRIRIGAEPVPQVLALARTNAALKINSSLLGILQLAGPAGTNALLELARADAPWLWWGAISRLPTRAFEPLVELSPEMQERVWLVKERATRTGSNAVIAAALARLPGLLTPELHLAEPSAWSGALHRLARYADRSTAMATMMKFLRDLSPEQLKYQPPADLVRQVNAWYRQDFGGLGAKAGGSSQFPEPNEWPGIVEDVLRFYEKLKKDGTVAPEK